MTRDRLLFASENNIEEVYQALESSDQGKNHEQINKAWDKYGENIVTYDKGNTLL